MQAAMSIDLSAPAELLWHASEEDPPEDWSSAIGFATLSEAVEAIFEGTPQTGHPWVRCSGQVFAPHEIEEHWRAEPDA
jgi:hypothetical protein